MPVVKSEQMSLWEIKMINLREVTIDDVDCLFRWRNDVDIFKYLGGGYNPVSYEKQVEITNAMIDDNKTGKAFRYIICNDNAPIGFAGLYDINKHNVCELGIYIGEKCQWGKGYASTAYNLIEQIAKEKRVRKIKLFVVEDNIPAVKMYSKLKFRKAGVLEKERLIDDKYHNVIIMEKLI